MTYNDKTITYSGDLASYDYDAILRDKQRNINSLYELADYYVDADPIFRGIINGVYVPFSLSDDFRLVGANEQTKTKYLEYYDRIHLKDRMRSMHDEGYIELAPCTPFERSIAISHTENSNIVTSEGLFLPHMAGQFLYLDGWKKIRQITDAHSAILSDKAVSKGTTAVPIVTMNEIEISGENLALTMLEVDYTPRVR